MDINVEVINNITRTLIIKQMGQPLCEEEALLKQYAIRATTEYCKWMERVFVEMRERQEHDRIDSP